MFSEHYFSSEIVKFGYSRRSVRYSEKLSVNQFVQIAFHNLGREIVLPALSVSDLLFVYCFFFFKTFLSQAHMRIIVMLPN